MGSKRASLKGSPKSGALSSEKEGSRSSPLTVDTPELNVPPSSPGRVRAMANNFSRHGCFCPGDQPSSEALLQSANLDPDTGDTKASRSCRRSREPDCPSDGLGDHGALNLKAQLGNRGAGQSCGREQPWSDRPESWSQRDVLDPAEEPVWKPQPVVKRHRQVPLGQTGSVAEYRRACYFGNSSSPTERRSRSCIQWDISPIASAPGSAPAHSRDESRASGPRRSQSTEDSFTLGAPPSPGTQNTSLPLLSPDLTPEHPPAAGAGAHGAALWTGTAPDEGVAPGSGHPRSGPELRPGSPLGASCNRADCCTLACGPHEARARAREVERESACTCSKRGGGLLPGPISSSTLLEDAGARPSPCSVPRAHGTFESKAAGSATKMSPQQTSAVLEYLSLPGFIEMSVDEPEGDSDVTGAPGPSSGQRSEKVPRPKPAVGPPKWQEQDVTSKKAAAFQLAAFSPAAASSARCPSQPVNKRPIPGEGGASSLLFRVLEEARPSAPSLEQSRKQRYGENTHSRAARKPSPGSAQTLVIAARGLAGAVSAHAQRGHLDGGERPLGPSEGSRANKVAARICQVPVPVLTRSSSAGPCGALSAMTRAPAFLRKSLSLGSQRREHFESTRLNCSNFHWPDTRPCGWGCSQSFWPWPERLPHRPPSTGSWEGPGTGQEASARSSYLRSWLHHPGHACGSPFLEPTEPRRQAAVFPDRRHWSPSYEDVFGVVPHEWSQPGTRAELLRSTNPGRLYYFPRGGSGPAYAPAPTPAPLWVGQARPRPRPDRTMKGGDWEVEGGRTSYASQSSGGGSSALHRRCSVGHPHPAELCRKPPAGDAAAGEKS